MSKPKTNLTLAVNGYNCIGKPFSDVVVFELVKSDNENDYGTKLYMSVTLKNSGYEDYVDVRYAGTRDINKLAKGWLDGYYGENLRSYKEI